VPGGNPAYNEEGINDLLILEIPAEFDFKIWNTMAGLGTFGIWSPEISHVAKGGLTLVLCLIGASLSPRTLHTVGWKAAVQGMLLWIFISVASLLLILYGHPRV
jgi:putative Mn2+ efflux pump MntP